MSQIREFFSNRFLSTITAFAVLGNIFFWIFTINHISPQSENVPLHYNIYFGIDLLGPWWYVLFLPGAGLLIIFGNFLISVLLLKRERLVAYFLSVASVVVQIFLMLTGYLSLTQLSNSPQ